jgi:hypothetical protein|tara:strand:- start:27 stop:368 length:342 start_codon:yes stop_codon:yes gene_type:complete
LGAKNVSRSVEQTETAFLDLGKPPRPYLVPFVFALERLPNAPREKQNALAVVQQLVQIPTAHWNGAELGELGDSRRAVAAPELSRRFGKGLPSRAGAGAVTQRSLNRPLRCGD